MSDRRLWVRRLGMPVAILVVAGGLTVRSMHRRQAQAGEVHDLILSLCEDLAAGRDPAARLRHTDTLIAGPLLSRLRSVVEPAGASAGALTVVAEPGDTSEAGTVGIEATHTALIVVDGRDMLGLRVVHPGDSRNIAIIGFWLPQPP